MASIPDEDDLYLRVCIYHFRRGILKLQALEPRTPEWPGDKDDCGQKSFDWSKLSTPAETVSRDTSGKCGQCYSLNSGRIREIGLEVDYKPRKGNPAHSTYHSSIPLMLARECCKSDSYEQPEEGQLEALLRIAVHESL